MVKTEHQREQGILRHGVNSVYAWLCQRILFLFFRKACARFWQWCLRLYLSKEVFITAYITVAIIILITCVSVMLSVGASQTSLHKNHTQCLLELQPLIPAPENLILQVLCKAEESPVWGPLCSLKFLE